MIELSDQRAVERLAAALDAASELKAAFRAFEQIIRPFGYISLDYASGPIVRWPMQGNLDWRPDTVYASFDWSADYFGTDYQKHDRMLPHMLTQTTPWLYWDLWDKPAADPVAHQIEKMARTRVSSGLSIPFHGPGLRFGAVNLGSDLSREELRARDGESRAEVFLLASNLHAYVRRKVGDAKPSPELSARQVECLTWAAKGKTAWETATILSLSESAVKKHLAAAAATLGANTGAHAVAIAFSLGVLSNEIGSWTPRPE